MAITPVHTAYRYYSSGRDTHAEIIITDNGSGGFKVEKPTADSVQGGNHMTWWITNATTQAHRVAVENFCVKATGRPEWPFDNPQSDATTDVPPGQQGPNGMKPGIGRIKLKTKNASNDHKGTWVYTYDVRVDGQLTEPELSIEWPV